jgi:hypothetical protein
MGKSLLVGGIATQGNNRSTNFVGHISHGTEANAVMAVSEDMTFSMLGRSVASGGTGTNNTRFRDTGANGNQLASGAGTGVVEDAVNSDALTTGDTFNILCTDTGTDPVYAYIKCNVEFASGHGSIMGTSANSNSTVVVLDTASSTRFLPLAGDFPADAHGTEATAQIKNRAYASWEAMQVRVTANARTNDSVFKNRINSADGTGVITYGAGVTGLVQDTAIGDAVGDADGLCIACTLLTGVEDLSVSLAVGTFKCDTGVTKCDVACGNSVGAARTASSTANVTAIGGRLQFTLAHTDAQCRVKVGFAGRAENLRCYVGANTLGGNMTLKLLVNGSAIITNTITAAAGSQWFENTSDVATLVATDELSFEWDEGTSGSATIITAMITLVEDNSTGQPTVKRGGGIPYMNSLSRSPSVRIW